MSPLKMMCRLALTALCGAGLMACEPLSMMTPPVTAPPNSPFYLNGKWGQVLSEAIDHDSKVFPCAPFSTRSGFKYPFFQIENAWVGQTSDLMTPKKFRSTQVFNLRCGDSYGNMGGGFDVALDRQIECPENTTLGVDIRNPKSESEKLAIGMFSGRERAMESEQDQSTRTTVVDGRTITMRTGTRVPKQFWQNDVRQSTFFINYLEVVSDDIVPIPPLVYIVLSCRR